jgi:hypothetical protein
MTSNKTSDSQFRETRCNLLNAAYQSVINHNLLGQEVGAYEEIYHELQTFNKESTEDA